MDQIAEHVMFEGGKRLRPLVVVLAARACGHNGHAHTETAVRGKLHLRVLAGGPPTDLLVCEHCGARLIITGSGASHYGCSTYLQGGKAACQMSHHLPRKVAELVVLEPIRRDLLAPEAIEHACQLIKG